MCLLYLRTEPYAIIPGSDVFLAGEIIYHLEEFVRRKWEQESEQVPEVQKKLVVNALYYLLDEVAELITAVAIVDRG